MASTYSVRVVPDASGWSAKLESQLDPVTRRIAENIKRELQRAVRDGLSGTGVDAKVRGGRTGVQFGDAFARATKTRIEAALRSLPTVQIGVATTAAEQHLRDLSARLKTLGEDFDLGIDDKKARAEIDALKRELHTLALSSPDIRIRVDAKAALAELEALKGTLNDNKRGNFFTRALDDLRNKLPIVDKAIGKLGDLGDVASKAAPYALPYAIVSAISLIGPLAGAATAALFGIAGAAGVAGLAFVGLREQMEAGVGQGAKMRGEFNAIGVEIGQLGRLAADALGPGLNNALDTIRRALPGFAPLIASVGSHLGNAARQFSFGLVTAFQKASPLINDFAVDIQNLSGDFENFTKSKDFTDFLAYAREELPKVGDALKSVALGVVSLGESLSTLGTNTLASVKGLGDLLGVIGKIGSFKVGGGKGGIADQLGLTSLGGIAGNIANPIGFGLNAYSVAKGKQGDAQAKASADAQSYIASRQKDYLSASTGAANALGVNNGAYMTANAAIKSTADQLAATTLQMQLQNDAAGLLSAALDALSGKNLGVATSLNSFQTGLLGLKDTFDKGTFSSTAFTTSAVAQRGALQTLVAAAQAHAEAVGKQTNSTAAATAALQADYGQIVDNTGATGAQRQAILNYIESIGKIPPVKSTQIDIDDQATVKIRSIQSYIDGLHDKHITLSVTQQNSVNKNLAIAQGSAQGNIFTPYANGGINAAHFAHGIEKHIPQIAKPNGLFRVWAEPETKGEAYIPFAMDRRNRATDILANVAGRFGYDLSPMAGMTAAAASSGGGSGSSLLGLAVTIDAGSIGTITGHVTAVADNQISVRQAASARQGAGGSAAVVH